MAMSFAGDAVAGGSKLPTRRHKRALKKFLHHAALQMRNAFGQWFHENAPEFTGTFEVDIHLSANSSPNVLKVSKKK